MGKTSPLLKALAIVPGAITGSLSVYWFAVRPWHRRWGATQNEVEAYWPGDDLIARPMVSATHAVMIKAPVSKVWPWLVQIGQGRGGFYSYEFVENAMGLKMENADRILPEWQNLQVGDVVPLAPDGSVDLPVVILQREKALVLRGDTRIPGKGAPPVPPGQFLAATWGFHLVEQGAESTRLIERFRLEYTPIMANEFIYKLFLEAGACVMERKMLLGIKRRAEGPY